MVITWWFYGTSLFVLGPLQCLHILSLSTVRMRHQYSHAHAQFVDVYAKEGGLCFVGFPQQGGLHCMLHQVVTDTLHIAQPTSQSQKPQ